MTPCVGLFVIGQALVFNEAHERGTHGFAGGDVRFYGKLSRIQGGYFFFLVISEFSLPSSRPTDGDERTAAVVGKLVIGEKMAIVGKNGSGKTTFVKLLCRLYDVTEGCIKVNGIDIRKYDYKDYCALFSVVFQDFQMFAFPVGENVAAGSEVDEALVIDAMNKAGLGERLSTLSQGLSTCIGKDYDEGGVSFSGGEKQKLAIARAVYKDAPFVIMDEPTAALDPEAEAEVFEGFDKMVGNKTAIYISHRLASCKFCEDILVFEEGKVVQHGSHDELVWQDGLYRQLWNAQAQYYT